MNLSAVPRAEHAQAAESGVKCRCARCRRTESAPLPEGRPDDRSPQCAAQGGGAVSEWQPMVHVGLPRPTGYVHPAGHSHHLARPSRAVTPPPIPVRSDEQFAAELAERMRRIREREGGE